MPDLGSIAIGGVSALVLIPLVVELAKSMGMSERLAPILAALIGVAATIVAQLSEENAEVAKWAGLVVLGFFLGLAAIGWNSTKEFYQGKAIERKLLQAQAEQAPQERTTAGLITSATVVGDTVIAKEANSGSTGAGKHER